MAKTIKFNLLMDEKSIKDISSLQENFCIDDILEIYNSGLLEKWLKVRGFDEYLQKLQQIDKSKSVLVELIKIFDIKKDDTEIQKAIYSLEFEEKRKQTLEHFQKLDNKLQNIINEYHIKYDNLKKEIVEKKHNMSYLKMASKEISNNYIKLFELDFENSYYFFKENAPLFIYAILMNEQLRDLLLKKGEIKIDLTKYFILDNTTKINAFLDKDFVISEDIENNKEYLQQLRDKFGIGLKDHLFKQLKEDIGFIEFLGETDNYWKDLEITSTKVMVISIPKGTYITNPNDTKEQLSTENVNGDFPILDGLLYKSNIKTLPIVYMKV